MHRFRKAVADAASVLQIICILSMHPASTAARLRHPMFMQTTSFTYMQKDPWQLNNVVADPAYATVKAELRERLLNWIQHAEGSRPTITD